MATEAPLLAAVMPVYNEAAAIREVIEDWLDALGAVGSPFLILAVDDGSSDGTETILRLLAQEHPTRLGVLRQPNGGHGSACRAGYEEALRSGAKWVLQVDSDGQCDPADFKRFWRLAQDADCVFGHRVKRADGLGRLLISRLCSGMTGLVAGHAVGDVNVPYRLMRADALQRALQKIPPELELQNIALTVVLRRMRELRWADAPISFRERAKGRGSLNFAKIVILGVGMLRQLRWLKP